MRTFLLTLLAGCCVIAAASGANDPLISPSAKTALPGGAGTGASSSSSSSSAASSPSAPARKLTEREREQQAEADLSAKIAERLAIMRANQQARVAAAAKARKKAEAVAVAAAVEAAKPRISNVWSYEGDIGPAYWGSINPAWAKCGSGNRQSPIDIRDGMKVDLEKITFDYRPSSFNVTDNGHTVQVMVGSGNYLTVGNRTYELIQFHFHRPSEERINGKGYEMVVHLVHKDSEGHLAILALLLERGKPQPVIQAVWNNLPLEKYDTAVPPETVVIDPSDLLPTHREYYTYMGSLTTPPCTEGVLWLVMKEPLQASPAQMALFSRLYPLNARPTQPGSGRIIKESN